MGEYSTDTVRSKLVDFAKMPFGYQVAAGIVLSLIFVTMNRKLRSTIKFYLKYITYFVYLTVISILGIPLTLRHPASCKSSWVYARFIGPVTIPLGIKWEMRHCKNILGDDQSAIFVSNHQSMFDILGMLTFWNKNSIRCTTIARNLFFWFWPVGLGMWLGGTLFIKRNGDSAKTIQKINEIAGSVFRDKNKLWVYVEGTRNKNPEHLMPFKKGAFRIAIEHQVPVIPVVFSPFYFIDWKQKRFDSGTVIMDVLEPIPTKGLTVNDLDDLIKKSYNLMSARNEQLRNEIDQRFKKKQ